ncbi:MAG TPA: ABC transporter ATP-binding protein [Smithellaceae bacterium]|mgnify:CR=1 FL=1|nr:ABC transporter ATP-binding protein [Smithellaceae bacterium]HRS89197.1 ABC transporter ATP-binding protein [Smithellaceae bacterium]HRV26121.1 ABC transporter ATP-binding protein [Smithellaceae bacterium]
MALLEIKDLVTVFDTAQGTIRAVDHVSLSVANSETVGVVGESGCGKTMLALSVMRLLPGRGKISHGEIIFSNKNLLTLSNEEIRAIRGSQISMIFQEPMTSLNPVFRVGEQIAEAIRLHRNVSAKEAVLMSVEQLREVGIPDPDKRARDYPHQLSGGMRQRVMIAMAMSCHPQLLLADEPTTALDVTIQAQVIELIDELKNKNQMAVLFITHDLGLIARHAQRIAVMYAGKIVENAPADKIFVNPAHPYTQGLIDSLPGRSIAAGSTAPEYLKTIPGTVPSLYDLSPGCRFYERCSYGDGYCAENEPPLTVIDKTHLAACWKTEKVLKRIK